MVGTRSPESALQRFDWEALVADLRRRFRCDVTATDNGAILSARIEDLSSLPGLSHFLFSEESLSRNGRNSGNFVTYS
jgi:uncharacterized UPF0160 family protein